MSAPICQTCGDEPFYPRCPDCGSIPLDRLHDMCREPLRQIAEDMVKRRAEQLTEVEQLETRQGRARVAL